MNPHRPKPGLPHDVPLWVDPGRETCFITVCCRPKGCNHLARPEVASAIFETVAWRNRQHLCFAHLFLLMPDHVHALLSFPPGRREIKRVIIEWKRWLARTLKVAWQPDFFEHRLRSFESRREKTDYILANPVRAGLVSKAEDWPYVWFPQTDGLLSV